jgi:hypothetical protein
MDDTQLLFSTNTFLGLYIAKKFYGNRHYIWFTTSFHDSSQPKTSDPLCRCQMLLKTIATQDTHDEFLENIRIGMERGAQTKLDASAISKDESLKIRALIDKSRDEACIRDWCMPIVVITTWSEVKQFRVPLPADKKASSSSIEILCNEVPRSVFDIFNLEDIMNDYNPFRRGDI